MLRYGCQEETFLLFAFLSALDKREDRLKRLKRFKIFGPNDNYYRNNFFYAAAAEGC
jgi:hypothetical protein